MHPKKEVQRFLSAKGIAHYRKEELRKELVSFIKTCRTEEEMMKREPSEKDKTESRIKALADKLLAEYYGTNGNGEKELVKEFLTQTIDPKEVR